MASIQVAFFADAHAFPHEDWVYLWNLFPAQDFQAREKYAVHVVHRVYSDVYVFYDVVDVPRKINANGQKNRLNWGQD